MITDRLKVKVADV